MTVGLSCSVSASTPDWSEGFQIPAGGRANPYNLSPDEFAASRERGRRLAIEYPVVVTGLLLPYQPLYRVLEKQSPNIFLETVQKLFRSFTEIKDFNSMLAWIGLHEYPKVEDTGIYAVPYPGGDRRPSYLMGLSLIKRKGATGFTFGCVACHSSNLFGKTVLGLTNRFPRANRLFFKSKQLSTIADPHIFQISTGATNSETQMMTDSLKNIESTVAKLPQQLGLDTSLAQVSLSLNRRANDPWAEKDSYSQAHPRPDRLDTEIADSKPAVWWNLKYKNRWLLDGSVVSGNPVFTNILWNELGRGVDLHDLDQWLSQNSLIIQDLVTAAFSVEAPPITDFFDASRIDLASARRGEVLFNQSCKKCHGEYLKDWSTGMKTVRVNYHAKTPVIDVGTDSHRYLGMTSLEKLNALTISQNNKTFIRAQRGYVPPPLVGIWARWPYFHNNSVPSLCAVLTVGTDRPRVFYPREALDPKVDFDYACNGYPTPHNLTTVQKLYQYDSSREGLSNAGHDVDILTEDGVEKFSSQDKKDLIQFLQTL